MRWEKGDDLCDCTFQRIGTIKNPYLAQTEEIRLCCIWAKLTELLPELAEFRRIIPAFNNPNTGQWDTEPMDWDGDFDMPRALWYRHLAAKENRPLDEVRRHYEHLNAPKAVDKKDPDRLVIAQHKVLEYFIVTRASEMETLQKGFK